MQARTHGKLIWQFLPQSFRNLEHTRQKILFYRQMRKMLNQKLINLHPSPVQSRELALTTSVMSEKDIALKTDTNFFYINAYRDMRFFLKALDKIGFNLNDVKTILDFGCGSARLLCLLRCMPSVRLIGTDINPLCVEWCRKNIAGIEFYQNKKHPPLNFLEESSVDLIFAFSVFTHIPLELQSSWLYELYRVLRPGGIFLCTVLGDSYVKSMLSQEEQKILERNGQYSIGPDHERISLSSKYTKQDDIFQTHDKIIESFGSIFNILDYIERGQNLLVLQK